MKKTKVTCIQVQNINDCESEINKNLEALQVNTKVEIIDIKTIPVGSGSALVQITYQIEEEPDLRILIEGDEV